MSFKFNPITGKLDLVRPESDGGSQSWQKTPVTVDNIFIINRTVNLQGAPLQNTDFVFVNGMLIKDDCYSISGTQLIFDPGLNLKVGYFLDIRYAI